jgi:ferredoxin
MLDTLRVLLSSGKEGNAMLDTMLAMHDRKLKGVPHRVEAPPGAAPRRTFTSTLPPDQLFFSKLSLKQRLATAPNMFKLMAQMKRSAAYYEHPLLNPKTVAPQELLEQVERTAREQGATAVRYVTLDDDCLFGNLGVPHRNAIVYTVRMDKKALDTAPSYECFREVERGYLRLATAGNLITELLRAQGFAAYPGTAIGGLTDYPRVAELAGLGTIGYHGCVITPGEGALLRLNTIYTSIENIPRRPPEPTDWIREFCAMCRRCVRECPAKAIHGSPRVLENGRVECIDSTACLDYFSANHGCGVCIDVCPFSQNPIDAIAKRFKGHPSAPKFQVRPTSGGASCREPRESVLGRVELVSVLVR